MARSFPDNSSEPAAIVMDAIIAGYELFSVHQWPHPLRCPVGAVGRVRLIGNDGINDRNGWRRGYRRLDRREQRDRRGDRRKWRGR